jgi:hypothetical protein
MQLLCRNKLADFETWWAVFETHADTHRNAGLTLEQLWISADDADEVFFLFNVDDRVKAEAFMDAPESTESGLEAGVLDGEYQFIEKVERF